MTRDTDGNLDRNMDGKTDGDPNGSTLDSAVELILEPRLGDIGDFQVKRSLPSARRKLVGPFIFLDQMGPGLLRAGQGIDVRPHPHICLATVTYLFEGEILHRDSLGVVQSIRPGEVNWMTAGRGIVHSERTPPDLRAVDSSLYGIQTWVALPREHEETDPAFAHHGADELPVLEGEGVHLRLIAGTLLGARSPVQTHSALFYADVRLDPGARLTLPPEHEERAAYLLEGAVTLFPDGTSLEPGRLVIFRPGVEVTLEATSGAVRLMLLGGEKMDGRRYVWWNFVSSSEERIEQAKADWKEGRFPPVPGETEFIPLPEPDPGPVVARYP